MSSKSARRRARKKRRTEAQQAVTYIETLKEPMPPPDAAESVSNRPTPERMARGSWAMPQGNQKSRQPVVDAASDVVGYLHVQRLITTAQEQAARHFQRLRRAYMSELEITEYKSCLAGSVPGYDDGEGNKDVIAEYRTIEARLPIPLRREVLRVCDANHQPASLDRLRAGLNLMAR